MTGGDLEAIDHFADVLVYINIAADRGKRLKIIKMQSVPLSALRAQSDRDPVP